MKTIKEYLSGQHDEELNVLVAEERGWMPCGWRPVHSTDKSTDLALGGTENWWRNAEEKTVARVGELPKFSTSLDACRELLERLTKDELSLVELIVGQWTDFCSLLATARQICVAWLIVKGVLK